MASLKTRIARAWAALHGRAFEAAQTTPQHPRPLNSALSPDSAVEMAGTNLRNYARHLDENHDLAIGVIDDLLTNVVGTGIVIEPRPKIANRVNDRLAGDILTAWDEWTKAPEVTGELPWAEVQRLACRAWLRDGEVFAQHVRATAPYPWEDSVRYRVELLDADMVPLDSTFVRTTGGNTLDESWRHGIRHDNWNRPVAYAVHLRNPNDQTISGARGGVDYSVKTVEARNILHLKFARRWPQTRGVPITHGIIRRLADIKDYEESERIAARVAASLTGYIKKSPDMIQPVTGDYGVRDLQMMPGMIFDDLLPGEEIGTIDTSRPSSELENFRNSQLRAVAAGTGTRYSAIAKDYSGTYSSQRQELIEARPHYMRLRDYFIARFVRPIYEQWLTQALLQNVIQMPSNNVPISALIDATFIGPGMGWIDPLKEVQAQKLAVESGFTTREQVIRQAGGDPRQVAAPKAPPQPVLTPVGSEDEQDEQAQA